MKPEELKERLTKTIWETIEPTFISYKFYEKDVWTLSIYTNNLFQLVGKYEIYENESVLFLKFGSMEYSVHEINHNNIKLVHNNTSFNIIFREVFH